jgi:DNA repair protein RadA/Sms
VAKAKKAQYVCSNCGSVYPKWQGQCAQCEEWNSIEIETASGFAGSATAGAKLQKLSDIEISESFEKQSCAIPFLDRVLSGGLPQGATVLLAGQPGTGKSTLLFQMFGKLKGKKLLYVSAEESASQVAARFRQHQQVDKDNLFVLTDNHLEEILRQIDRLKPDVIAVDSIQMIMTSEFERVKGGVASIREVSEALVSKAKSLNSILWIVGHVTKDGDIAGPKTLEHLVDTVLLFSNAEEPQVRMLQTQKHRFGQSGELAVLEISDKGLREKPGAESYWMQEHSESVAGCAFSPVLMGSRVYCVEVQALCVPTHFPSPRRSTTGFEMNRVYLVLAVLEKILKLTFAHQDVCLNVVGGLKVNDPAMDLAVGAALVSAHSEKTSPSNRVYCGEIGLTGEIRNVPLLELRRASSAQIGKTDFICAKSGTSKVSEGMRRCRHIREAFQSLV